MPWKGRKKFEKLCSLREDAWKEWNEMCLEWGDEWLEEFVE